MDFASLVQGMEEPRKSSLLPGQAMYQTKSVCNPAIMIGDQRCSRWDAEGLGFASRDSGHRFSLSALSSRHVLRLLAVGADVEHMSDVLVGSRTCNLLGALQILFLRASRTPRAGGLQRKASVVGRPSTRGMLVFIKSTVERPQVSKGCGFGSYQGQSIRWFHPQQRSAYSLAFFIFVVFSGSKLPFSESHPWKTLAKMS